MRTLLPQLAIGLPPAGDTLLLDRLFPTSPRRLWLEIGFGSGEHLAELAARHGDTGFLGCEIFLNGIAALLDHVVRRCLSNVRIHPDDARALLDALPAASIERAFLLFPDPWPKRRHQDRRFIRPENLARLARVLSDGAGLEVASDDPGYIAWTLEHVLRHGAFEWLARRPCDWRERPTDWPATRYEMKALAAGRPASYLRFRRRPRSEGSTSAETERLRVGVANVKIS